MKRKVALSLMAALLLFSLTLVPAMARVRASDSPAPQLDTPVRPIVRPHQVNLVGQVETTTALKTMAAAIKIAGLENVLKTKGPYTIFAPSDEAFAKLPQEKVDALFKDPARLRAFIMQHVVSGNVTNRDLVFRDSVVDVAGISHSVAVKGRALLVGDAKVVRSDVEASNGTIYVIDTVLVQV